VNGNIEKELNIKERNSIGNGLQKIRNTAGSICLFIAQSIGCIGVKLLNNGDSKTGQNEMNISASGSPIIQNAKRIVLRLIENGDRLMLLDYVRKSRFILQRIGKESKLICMNTIRSGILNSVHKLLLRPKLIAKPIQRFIEKLIAIGVGVILGNIGLSAPQPVLRIKLVKNMRWLEIVKLTQSLRHGDLNAISLALTAD
jgi:hypothetical protein